MRAKLIHLGFALVVTVALMIPGLAAPAMQATAAPPSPQEKKNSPAKPRKRMAKKRAETGIPKGVPACIDALIKMAEKDPLPDYDGRPSEIINGGLMWNDPKSKCSIGNDNNLRLKLLDLSNAWRAKDSAKARSLLEEIKAAAPQG